MEQLNIEIGGVIENTFDYTLTPAQLDKQLSERMESVKRGEIKPTHELSMLGYALDFIDFAQQNVNIAINFDEDNLVHLCSILGLIKNSFAQNPPPNDIMASYVKAAAGFFGVMIIKNLGGNWVETSAGMSVSVNGTTAFITNRIAGILSGADENENAITEIYGYLKTQSGAANAE
ncbi:MAG: hypothetical protein J1F03_03080 [Oscillospiraceae bacterium]|nr:hypothetical protein [Oscillospiraceae bacterium]